MKTERKLNTEWTTPYLRICRCRRPSCGSPYRRWPATSSRSSTIWPIPSSSARPGDEFQVAAVTLTSPVFMALTALGILFGIGGGSFISRQLGERKPENACKASALCFWGSLGLGVLFLAAGIAAPAAARYAARRLGRNLRVHARLSADHPARLARNPAFQHARTAHPRGGRGPNVRCSE